MKDINKLMKCITLSNKMIKRLDEINTNVILYDNHEDYEHELKCIHKVYCKIMKITNDFII